MAVFKSVSAMSECACMLVVQRDSRVWYPTVAVTYQHQNSINVAKKTENIPSRAFSSAAVTEDEIQDLFQKNLKKNPHNAFSLYPQCGVIVPMVGCCLDFLQRTLFGNTGGKFNRYRK